MIIFIVASIGILVIAAVIVGISDAAQAPSWRRVAAERRDTWEFQHPEFQHPEFQHPEFQHPEFQHPEFQSAGPSDADSWDDD